MQKKQKNRDVRNLLMVLGFSVFCAGLLTYAFIHYYGPLGHYLAGHVLLDPSTIEEINDQSSQNIHFSFDRFEFSYFDKKAAQVQKFSVSKEQYQDFYQSIASLKSLENSEAEIEQFFIQSHPTLLTTSMRTLEGTKKTDDRLFQIVEFVEEDYFRIQLKDNLEHGGWVYFYQPHLFQQVMQLFNSSEKI